MRDVISCINSQCGASAGDCGCAAKAREAAAEIERLRAALQELAECDFNKGNCASLEIASARVRALARHALEEKL